MKLKLIGCTALDKELYYAAAHSPHQVEVVLLSPAELQSNLSFHLAQASCVDYILLGCGACATLGAESQQLPCVLPKAHDCANLLLETSTRYHKAFAENDDCPNWITPQGCGHINRSYGVPCAVISPLRQPVPLPEGAHEYIGGVSLLMDLTCGDWNESFLVLPPHSKVVEHYEGDLLGYEPK